MDSPSSLTMALFMSRKFTSLPAAAFKVLFPKASCVPYSFICTHFPTIHSRFFDRHSNPESSVYFVRKSRKGSLRNSSPCAPVSITLKYVIMRCLFLSSLPLLFDDDDTTMNEMSARFLSFIFLFGHFVESQKKIQKSLRKR